MRAETIIQAEIRAFIAAAGFHSVHVPNGAVLAGDGAQRARQMAALKRAGLVPGFPDLLVYGPGQRIGHIEVKAPKGTTQDTQRAVRSWLEAWGHKYAICRSAADAAKALRDWGWL